ncbi:MAG: phage tail sheath subtilisin-like domain-containing protein, partial [Acidimicrobiales bacterium]
TATDLVTGTTVTRLRSAALAQPDQLNLGGASTRLYGGAVVELDSGRGKETLVVDQTAGDLVTFTSDVAGAYLENHKARVIEAEVSVRYEPDIGDPTDETFGPLRLVEDDSASSLVNNVNARSNLVTVATGAGYSDSIVAFPTAAGGGWANAAGGDDGNAGLSVDDFMGIDPVTGDRQGIDALELIDEVAICVTPGMWSQTVRNALTQHCELLQDRFAIVDPRDGLDIEGVREFRSPIDTRYAALYYPWLRVRDPAAGREVTAPPSGHMAGIYARVDVERGVHKAPANVVVRGINGFEKDVTKREQDLLNPQGINAFRFFPGRGNRVWGARTLTSDSAWKYVNVRRLFIFVEESIDEGTQWVVFEPNAEPLWARVRASVTNFLTTVWRSGALEGTTAEQAFFVVCDRTTMTQDDIDNGRLICLVGIAPVKPAEFVIFRIQQKTLEVVA